MLDKLESKLIVLLYVCCASIDASKCPEARKPHVTSCTIFYNCINLPGGGYVWVPGKCSEGLVFQPYLRICVLPGDTWTCDELSTEKPQLSDPPRANYHQYERDSASTTGSPSIDASYTITDNPGLGNVGPLVTPYPLIEITRNREKIHSPTRMTENNERVMENYLHEFFVSQEKLRTRLNSASSMNQGQNGKYTWLRGIIDRILLYENYEGYSSSASCRSNDPNNDRFDALKYLVESYVLGTRNPTRHKSKKNHRKSTMTKKNEDSVIGQKNNSADWFERGTKFENNIVVIEGNLGEREYVTGEKYKLLSAAQINLRVVEILPCARGVRLPNSTDCSKYYTCDPESANIAEFSCPPKTAFNNYTRVCDAQRYKICSRQLDQHAEETTANFFTTENNNFSDATEIPEDDEPCRNPGKFVDRVSDKHYYVCYSSQANPSKIESLRMTCPNNLIFCQERRVCSTRKRCYDA